MTKEVDFNLQSDSLDCYIEMGHSHCSKCGKHLDEWDDFALVHHPTIDKDLNKLYCKDCLDISNL